MNKKITNPFITISYAGKEYFCDRKNETETLISGLKNGRNITLISPRRMGKTGLIKHIFAEIEAENKDIRCFYLDIFSTSCLADFVKILGETVIGGLDSSSTRVINKVFSFFKNCRPKIIRNEITGSPELTIDFAPSQSEATLKEIFEYLGNAGKTCYIAIDEFQQVTYYPEKGTEALLRSYIQFLPNVKFIFSGSKRHIMNDIFTSPQRPFFQSTQMMSLKEIDINEYRAFARQHLAKAGKDISDDIFNTLYNNMLGHTWYVQYLLNVMFGMPVKTYTEVAVANALMIIMSEQEETFITYCKLLTNNQKMLLYAISQDDFVKEASSNDFMVRHALPSSSSIRLALSYLVENELVLETDRGYRIYNRFFSLWLKAKSKNYIMSL